MVERYRPGQGDPNEERRRGWEREEQRRREYQEGGRHGRQYSAQDWGEM